MAAAVAFAVLAAGAQATHWPQFGADEGHSGFQPADQAALPMKYRWRDLSTATGSPTVRTSAVISSGATLSAQRIVYGYTRSDDGYLRSVRFADGSGAAEADIDDEAPLEGTSQGTIDPDQFGTQTSIQPVEASSHISEATQTYLIHNDDNQPYRVRNPTTNQIDTTPQGAAPNALNDIALAQIDTDTGTLMQDVPLGQPNPVSGTPSTHGFTIESSPVLAADVEGTPTLYFTMRNAGGSEKKVCSVGIPNASTDGVHTPTSLSCSGNLADLNTLASPTLMRLRDPSTAVEALMVVLPTNDGLRSVRTTNLNSAGPSISGIGRASTPSLPVRSNGNRPNATPFFYVATASGVGTQVHKLLQPFDPQAPDPEEQATFILAEPDGRSPELSGTPGPALSVAQTFDAGFNAAPGRVVVTTSSNVFSLSTENMSAANPPQVFPSGLSAGFSKTAPASSGELGFAVTDDGDQFVFYLTPRGGTMRVPLNDAGFQPIDQALDATAGVGQPAISRGRVVFPSNNGMYVYGPSVTITEPQANAVVRNVVPVSAYVFDPQLTTVTFKLDGAVIAAGVAVQPDRTAIASFDSTKLSEGAHSLTAEATDGSTLEVSAPRAIIVDNWADPTAQLTVAPNPANEGQPATLNAEGSEPTPGENETIVRWAFEVDGDNDYDDIVETPGAGGDGIVQHTFATSGQREVGVRVTDSHGDFATAVRSLSVNDAPSAALAATPNPAAAGQAVELDASGSSDSDGSIARYEFDLDGDGSYERDNGASPRLSQAFSQTTEVGVRVTDNGGAQGVARVTIAIGAKPSGQPPQASFAFAPSPGVAGRPVAFNANASRDPDGRIVRYEWDFDGNGTFEASSATAGIAHTYATAGVYRVTLRVTDDGGNAATATHSVAVAASSRCTTATRCRPGLRASVTPRRDARLPLRFVTSGRLKLPRGVARMDGCAGRVVVRVKRGKRTISTGRHRVNSRCRFTGRVKFRNRKRLGRARTLRFIVRFQGNRFLAPRSAKVIRVRIR